MYKTLKRYQEYRDSRRSKIVRSLVAFLLNMIAFHILCSTSDPIFDNFCITMPLCIFLMVTLLYSIYRVLLSFDTSDMIAEDMVEESKQKGLGI